MIEGLWTGEWEWETTVAKGKSQSTGVIYFKQGRILGGDAHCYCVGNYNLQGSMIDANLNFVYYRGHKMELIGDLTEGQVHLSGQLNEPVMELDGQIGTLAAHGFKAILTKRSDL